MTLTSNEHPQMSAGRIEPRHKNCVGLRHSSDSETVVDALENVHDNLHGVRDDFQTSSKLS